MGIVIGIDVGISTTKIVGIDEQGKVLSPIRIRATDPVTSLYGAFGKYLHENHIKLSDVEKVMLTGVGSAYINEPVYGLSTDKAEEFVADGLGARYETKLDRMLVVSLGTGTSIVKCDGDDIKHIGGIGIGGGTLQGLSRLLLKTDDIKQVAALAEEGDIS
ncbi:BadF/BadG/BcrA/BcrD ATPase family protein, partial [Prevotella sp.]